MVPTTVFDLHNAKVNYAGIFREKDKWYLTLKYLIEDDQSIREVTIPKINIPLEYACINSFALRSGHDETVLTFPLFEEGFRIEKTEFTSRYLDNNVPTLNSSDGLFFVKLIKIKEEEMTMEELEKRLGHKVKIVNHH